jgi:hypothetical protein
MEYAHLALHLLPTVAVVALALIIARAVSIRVTWRRSTVRRLDDATAPRPLRGARRLDASSPRAAESPAASPLRSHAA